MDCAEKIMNITAPMYIVPGCNVYRRGSNGDEFIGTVERVVFYPAVGYKFIYNRDNKYNFSWYDKDELVVWN